jgi:hypothetical protein
VTSKHPFERGPEPFDGCGAAQVARVAPEGDPLNAEDLKRKGKQGVLAGRVDVGAPELPAKERSAHLGALLSGVEGVERGGAQDRTGPLVCHGKGKAGGIGYFGFKQGPELRGSGWQRRGHSGPHRGIHEVVQGVGMLRRQRDKGESVAGQDCLVMHCSIESVRGLRRNRWRQPEK